MSKQAKRVSQERGFLGCIDTRETNEVSLSKKKREFLILSEENIPVYSGMFLLFHPAPQRFAYWPSDGFRGWER